MQNNHGATTPSLTSLYSLSIHMIQINYTVGALKLEVKFDDSAAIQLIRMEFGKIAVAVLYILAALSVSDTTLSKKDKKTKSKDKKQVKH